MSRTPGKLLLQTLDNLTDEYQKRLKICRKTTSEHSVHDLRTCSRRLLSLLDLYYALAPQPQLRQLRKLIKMQLQGFAELRDIQMMLIETREVSSNLPTLMVFVHHLRQREASLQRESHNLAKKLSVAKLQRKLKRNHRHCQKLCCKSSLFAEIEQHIDQVYANALERYHLINPEQLSSIHQFRIAVKKLRYLLEVTYNLLPHPDRAQTQRIQHFLSLLGDIQDSAVLTQALQAFFNNRVPEPIHIHFQLQQTKLLETFMAGRHEFLTFWQRNLSA